MGNNIFNDKLKEEYLNIIEARQTIDKEVLNTILKNVLSNNYSKVLRFRLFYNTKSNMWNIYLLGTTEFPISVVSNLSQVITINLLNSNGKYFKYTSILDIFYSTVKIAIAKIKITADYQLENMKSKGEIDLSKKDIRIIYTFRKNTVNKNKKSLVKV